MVTTNIVRKVDRVGRVSLPLSLRERLGFAKQDPLEMHAEENRIIVQRYIPACFFCGSGEGLKTFHSVPVCAACPRRASAKTCGIKLGLRGAGAGAINKGGSTYGKLQKHHM